MIETQQFPLIAKTMAELEDVLAEELITLGADNVEIGTRMVSFTGDKALMYKANLHCRTALRILKPVYSFKAENADEVYEALKQLDWEEFLTLDTTFSIDAVVFSHIFHHSKFVAYRVKDAIADWFNEKYDKRPSVSVSNPDIVFNIHVAHNKCTLSLDSSGESLHKRGYRVAQTEAPLSEVLAAGMILKSGWHGESTFVDPMCGSGTLLIEAAMIALGIPPGIHRPHFAFEKWKDFDEELFSTIYNDDSSARVFTHRIVGSDISPVAIAIAEKNIKSAGLKKYIDLSVKPLQQYTEAPADGGVLITNPPYGERIRVEELEALYAMIGERLKHVFLGFNAYVLSYRKESFDAIGLKHSNRFFLYNGALECEMREYEIFSGKRKELLRSDDSRENRRRKEAQQERNSKEGYRRSNRSEHADEDASRGDYNRNRGEERTDRKEERPFTPRDRSHDSDRKTERRSSDHGSKPERRPHDSGSRPERRPYSSDSRPERRSFDSGSRPERRPYNPDSRTDRRSSGSDNRPERRPYNTENRPERRSFNPDSRPERRSSGSDKRPDRRSFDSDKPRDFRKRDDRKRDDAPYDSKRKSDGAVKELKLSRFPKKKE
ncbi:MAG: RNA methyltransferase [Bacteroidales bacterium]|jgi:putative N6-adenine-specific DNA methylase|nr:RNA methyltransferase [Bacteroidales bacterium]